MSERTTCYERDEAACEDYECIRLGCKMRKERLSRGSPASVTLPEWEDTRVQIVYNMLCDDALNTPPNPEEHWEGWVSRNIVAALCGPVAQPPAEPVAYQFRQRSGVGKGPQSSAPWCDWCCIERETYDQYIRQPNKLVQVRPLYAVPSSPAADGAWQPMETAPKDGTEVLLVDDDSPPMIVIAFWQSGSWLVAWDHQNFSDPTHWMPLPTPPMASTHREDGK